MVLRTDTIRVISVLASIKTVPAGIKLQLAVSAGYTVYEEFGPSIYSTVQGLLSILKLRYDLSRSKDSKSKNFPS